MKTDNRKAYMVLDKVTGLYVRKDGVLVESPVKLRGHREATRAVLTLLRENNFAARDQTVVLPYKRTTHQV